MAPAESLPSCFTLNPSNSRLCMTDMLKMAEFGSQQRSKYLASHAIEVEHESNMTWVDIGTALEFCKSHLPQSAPSLKYTLQELRYLPEEEDEEEQEEEMQVPQHQCGFIDPLTGIRCTKMFTQKSSMGRHMRAHQPSFKCDKCNKLFGTKGDLDRHLRTTLTHNGRRHVVCGVRVNGRVCGATYTREDSLQVHQRQLHQGRNA